MSVDEKDTHPSAMSAEEKAELDKLVAEEETELGAAEAGDDAGDDAGGAPAGDATDEGAGDPPAAAAAGKDGKPSGKEADADADGDGDDAAGAEPEGKGKDGAAAAGAAADDGADGDKAAASVDRKQYDGVMAELRQTRDQVKTLREVLTAPRQPLPERDFDAEDKAIDEKQAALDKRYDDEGMSDEEYRAEQRQIERDRRALDRDRNKYELLQQLEEERQANEAKAAKEAKEAAEKAWADKVTDWETNLGDWLKNPVRRATVSQTMAMMNADPALSQLDNDAYLAKLEEFLADAFPNFPKSGKAGDAASAADAGDGKEAAQVDPRRKLAAQRAAEATGAPPRIEGGVGNRGTRTEDIDVEHMPHVTHTKTGAPVPKFSQLPEHTQNELLGIE